MLGGQAKLPAPLRLQILVAAADLVGREVGGADEVVEIELRDGPPDRGLGMPAAAGLPVDGEVGLEELERSVGYCVAAYLEVREFVIDAAVEAQRRRDIFADAEIDFPALLLDGRILDRKRDRHALAILIDQGESDMIVERVQRS